ncbi:MAG: helix-turn-helix domain-containing protein [Pseudomonadota bacterium]
MTQTTFATALAEPNQLSQVAPWDIDFRQMSAGTGETRVSVRNSRSLFALRLGMQCDVHQFGASPKDLVTFGYSRPGALKTWMRGEVPEGALYCFGSGQEFESVSRAGFAGVTLSIPTTDIWKMADELGLNCHRRVEDCGLLDLSASPWILKSVSNAVDQFFELPEHSDGRDQVDEICLSFLRATTDTPDSAVRTNHRLRERSLRRALEFIEARADDFPGIRELCVQSGASWTTLNRAFFDHFNIGPKKYLTNLRLNRVRTELLGAPAGTKVADIANQWGFWHMGQFAADYRRFFNCLPSEHLHR